MKSKSGEKQEKAVRARAGPKYGDCRDNLWANCEHCGAELAQAEVRQATAHGIYACGSKFLAWPEVRQGPVCVRLCGKNSVKVESTAEKSKGLSQEEMKAYLGIP